MLKTRQETNCATWRRLALAGLLAAVTGIAAPAVAADRFVPAPPEAGSDIPKATSKFGMRPYADNTFYIIGMKKGWFDEVGIKFDPPPYGIKANRPALDAILRYHHEQGITDRRFRVEDVFAPCLLDT